MNNQIFGNVFGRIAAVVGVVVNYLFGGLDAGLKTLLLFMLIDYVSGILRGYHQKQLSSEKAFDGIMKKMCILIMITVGTQLDLIMDADGYMRSLVIFYYLGCEIISIIENVSHYIPVPQELVDSLEQLQEGFKKEKRK